MAEVIQFEWQNPLVQMLANRLALCRQSHVDLAAPMSFQDGSSSRETRGEWVSERQAELGWVERSLSRAGFNDDVPATDLRFPTRDAALSSFINQPRPEGVRWPLHYAAGLYWHTLHYAELLLWPDVLKDRDLGDAA